MTTHGVAADTVLDLLFVFFLAFFLAIVGSLAVDRWQTPKSVPLFQRPFWANAANVLFLVGIFGFFFALTQRPWLAMALTIAIATLLTLVNNAKYQHLREPFLACDFIYFWEAVRYPQLYLPYFGYIRAGLLLLAFLVALGAWLWLEPSFGQSAGLLLAIPVMTGFFMALIAWLLIGLTIGRPNDPLTTDDPAEELRRWGLIALLLRHRALQRQTKPVLETPFLNMTRAESLPDTTDQSPHFVCIQAESFFDVRRTYPERVASDWLTNWDALRANAVASGTLAVPAWGANTVRSEFAFLTGISDAALGVHRFQPYQMLLKAGSQNSEMLSLPHWFRNQGYQTTFMHPYLATFYARNKILPMLGFDKFIDIQAFNDHPPQSGYVTDTALGQRVIDVLRVATDPLYLHVVTMQGHGPYGPMDSSPEATLSQYLARMQYTDQMLRILREGFANSARPVVLCVFGDHLPMLPSVYDWLGTPVANTDYLIWTSQGQSVPNRSMAGSTHLHLGQLAEVMLRAGGFCRQPEARFVGRES